MEQEVVSAGLASTDAAASTAASVAGSVRAGSVPAGIAHAGLPQGFTARLLPIVMPGAAEGGSQPLVMASELARANRDYPSREQSMQSLHAALAGELLKVPGLSLVDVDPVEEPASGKHFRLRLGLLSMYGRDDRPTPVDPRYLQVALSAEELKPSGNSRERLVASQTIDVDANCFGYAPGGTPCLDVPSVAVAMAKALIQDVFPPSTSMTAPLQARFRDASADITQRLDALEELYRLQARTDSASLMADPGVVRAAIEIAETGDPDLRARIWRSLRVLRGDPESLMRSVAAENLGRNHLGKPGVREALARARDSDPDARVRESARVFLDMNP